MRGDGYLPSHGYAVNRHTPVKTLSSETLFSGCILFLTLLSSATKLRRLCFYRCLSVHGEGVWSQGGSASVHAGIPPRSRHPPGTRFLPRQTATVADGKHPTGMHSCEVELLLTFPVSGIFR